MKLTLNARALISIMLGAAMLLPLTADATDSGRGETGRPEGDPPGLEIAERSKARFEGRDIDMSKDWGEADACWIHEDGSATCYRNEAELDAAIARAGLEPNTEMPESLGEGFARANGYRVSYCSQSIRLYKGSWYSYSLLYISQRYRWLNLSWYGFNNSVSSYKIGSCSSTFRSLNYGGGSTYYGGTYAYKWKSYMGSWDNVLSSLYIY